MIIQMYFNVVNVIVVNASCESWCHSAPCIVIASSVIGIYREQCYDPSFWHCPSLCYVLSVRTAHTWGGTYPRNLGLATFWDILGKLLKWDFFDGNNFNNYWKLYLWMLLFFIRASSWSLKCIFLTVLSSLSSFPHETLKIYVGKISPHFQRMETKTVA